MDRDSTTTSILQFGPSAVPDANKVTKPLLQNHKIDIFYYISITRINVGRELLSISPSSFSMDETSVGIVIVDSGMGVTHLQTDAYTILCDAFIKCTGDLPAASSMALFDIYYDSNLDNCTSTNSLIVSCCHGG